MKSYRFSSGCMNQCYKNIQCKIKVINACTGYLVQVKCAYVPLCVIELVCEKEHTHSPKLIFTLFLL